MSSNLSFSCENRGAKCQTETELEQEWSDIFSWLEEHNLKYDLQYLDNALYSDVDEDSLIGYIFSFTNKADAALFKLTWG